MKKYLICLLLILLMGACGPVVSAPSMPHEMPDDFAFSIQFGVDKKNEINSYDGTVTKDLIADGTTTADISLTSEEMNTVYELMREVNILEEKELIPDPIFDEVCVQEPHEDDEWKITMNGETIIISIDGTYCEPTKDAKQLIQIRDAVFTMIKDKDEFKALPDSTGGYD